jgi:hypothetical protein
VAGWQGANGLDNEIECIRLQREIGMGGRRQVRVLGVRAGDLLAVEGGEEGVGLG